MKKITTSIFFLTLLFLFLKYLPNGILAQTSNSWFIGRDANDGNQLKFYQGDRSNTVLGISGAGGLLVQPRNAADHTYINFKNSGGYLTIGRERSSAGGLLAGDIPYSAVITTDNASPLQLGTNNTVRMTINSDGNIDVSGVIRATDFVKTSDARLKKNIQTLDNVLGKAISLQPVSFNWQDESKGKQKQLGLIAQDVEKYFPEVVSTDSQGYKAVSYEQLIPVLFQSIKQQQQEIDLLKQQVESLKNQ